MTVYTRIKENWLTRKPEPAAYWVTVFLTLLVLVMSSLHMSDGLLARSWMPASNDLVVGKNELWRLWTTLFAHSDLEHLLANLLLFVPLSYFLAGYFGVWFFPLVGILSGGLVNLLVLRHMGPSTYLIGISGVVYWMGAAWLSLYLWLENRESVRRRLGKVLVITLALFFPQSFQQNVSYLSHVLGFLVGAMSGTAYYMMFRSRLRSADVIEVVVEEDETELGSEPEDHSQRSIEDGTQTLRRIGT